MRLLLVNLSLLACLLGLSTVVVPVSAAPVPKDEPNRPKTTAEKLVGKWKFVRYSKGNPVPPELDKTIEFTKDGKVINCSTDPKHGYREESGTYTVTGNTIHFVYKSRPQLRKQNIDLAIKELTRNKLVFTDQYNRPEQDHGHEFRRIKEGGGK